MVFVYWDELPGVNLENMLKELATQIGKAKVREHPMPGYVPPKGETYTPVRVLTEFFIHAFGVECANLRANDVINRLKKYGFEITHIKGAQGQGFGEIFK